MKRASVVLLLAWGVGCEAYDREGFARLLAARADGAVGIDGSATADAGLDAGSDGVAAVSDARLDATPPRDAAASDAPVSDAPTVDRVVAEDRVTPRDVVAPRDAVVEDAGPGCSPLRVPAAPTGVEDTPGGREFVVAMHRVSLGMDAVGWRTAGYDRDDLCTLATSPLVDTPCAPRLGGMSVPDGERGRDNAFGASLGAFLETLGGALGFSEAALNAAIDGGVTTLALRVSGLGAGDDPAVTVEWLPALNGLRGLTPPTWSGEDVWAVDRTLAYNPGTTEVAVRVTDAYVRGDTLVAELPARATFALAMSRDSGDFVVHLTRAALVLRLDAGHTTATSMEVTGAWPVADVLRDVGYFGLCAPTGSGGVDMATWTLFSAAVDRSADIPASGRGSPVVACDAVSLGFRADLATVTLRNDGVRPIARCR